jgi:DNA-directed RNA polymerase subunit RPC12/RpoP
MSRLGCRLSVQIESQAVDREPGMPRKGSNRLKNVLMGNLNALSTRYGMFFLIGGVQPKTISLDETPKICSACGLAQARLKRVDYYLSLFFIPLFPVKKGGPVLICSRCGAVSPEENGIRKGSQEVHRDRCPQCGYSLDRDFRYCPSCGSRI